MMWKKGIRAMSKKKGTKTERELIELFWNTGTWGALRAPGSGSARHPSPDIIASNQKRVLAIECKASKSEYKYIEKEEVDQLRVFSEVFGAESWIGARFNNKDWLFVRPEELKFTGTSYVLNFKEICEKGKDFSKLISD